MQKVSRQIIAFPVFVKVKKGSSYTCLLKYKISNFFYYTVSKTRWDRENSSDIYYINELGIWIPSEHFDVITGTSPN